MDNLHFIDRLLDEKNRVIGEKEELRTSKSLLREEYHQQLQQRDSTIEDLKELLATQKVKTQELARLLDTYLDHEDDGPDLDHFTEQNGAGAAPGGPKTRENVEIDDREVSIPQIKGEHHEVEEIQNRELHSLTPNATHARSSLAQPVSAMADQSGPAGPAGGVPLPQFSWECLYIGTGGNPARIAGFDGLDPKVRQAKDDAMASLRAYHSRKTVPIRPVKPFLKACGGLWMRGSTNNVSWTVSEPRKFACKTCYNRNRLCFTWEGRDKWLVLPLPAEVRAEGATWKDASYYLNETGATAHGHSDVWGPSTYSQRSSKHAVAQENEHNQPEE